MFIGNKNMVFGGGNNIPINNLVFYGGYEDSFIDSTLNHSEISSGNSFSVVNFMAGMSSVYVFNNWHYLDYSDGLGEITTSFGNSIVDSPFSISFGFRLEANTYGYLMNKRGNGTGNEWMIYAYSDNTILLRIYDDSTGGYIDFRSSITITNLLFAHIVFTYDGNQNAKLYVNNNEDIGLTKTITGVYVAMEQTGVKFRMGTVNNTSICKGWRDCVGVFDIELTSEDVDLIYTKNVINSDELI